MKITIYFGPQRKNPKAGDIRVTKKHGVQVRVPEMCHDRMGRVIGYNCTGGRQNYEWRKPDQLNGTPWAYLLNTKSAEIEAVQKGVSQ